MFVCLFFPIFVCYFSWGSPLFPGDKLYPSDTSGEAEVNTNTDAQREDPQDDSGLHRIVVSDPYTATLQVTITPKYNHLLPVVGQAFPQDTNSQLWLALHAIEAPQLLCAHVMNQGNLWKHYDWQ